MSARDQDDRSDLAQNLRSEVKNEKSKSETRPG